MKSNCGARPKPVENRRKIKVRLAMRKFSIHRLGSREDLFHQFMKLVVPPAREIAKKVRRYASLQGELWRCGMGIEKIVWNVERLSILVREEFRIPCL